METNYCGARLCSPALGMAFGVVSGVMMLLLAWAGMFWGFGTAFIDQYSLVFYGYSATFTGGLFGLLWGFIEGFIFGLIVGWVYNFCSRCCGSKSGGACQK